jgi:uncharacterized protein (TIGR00299 family) protein
MALGAFVDLGVDPDLLRSELEKLGVDGWKLEFHRDQRCGISGTNAIVDLGEQNEQDHHHPNDQHGHDHYHDRGHNSWKEIRALIEASGITGGAKKRALDIFTRIARAESQVHGVPTDEIAFHEVGALDSIIDILGAAVCLDILKPEKITCGEIELGGGTVQCAHGVLPVPAPATLILCQGLPVKTGGFQKEMTTPTGAAILAASVDEFVTTGSFREIKTGYGIGKRQMEKPNVLRLSWREEGGGESPADTASSTGAADLAGAPWRTEELVLMEANIDDMTGEALGFLMESLFAAGALDVTFIPCGMKKSRPGTMVSVLCPPPKLNALRRIMFQKSSTIGFRETTVRRLSLRREESAVQGVGAPGSTPSGASGGPPGEFRRKTMFFGEKELRSKVEYEDRARIARERGISLEEAERLIENGKA